MWSVECKTNQDMERAKMSLENVWKFRYLGTKITNQNSVNQTM
jgi:hypothetical protein